MLKVLGLGFRVGFKGLVPKPHSYLKALGTVIGALGIGLRFGGERLWSPLWGSKSRTIKDIVPAY